MKTEFIKERRCGKATSPHSLITGKGGTHELNVPARASVAFTLSSLISRGAALVFTPFFTRLLSTEEYGGYALFNSYLSLITLIGTLELGGGVIFRIFQKNHGRENQVMRSALVLIFCTMTVTYLAFLAINLTRGEGEAIPYANLLLPITALSSSVISIFTAHSKFKYKYKISLLISALGGILAPLLAILLIRFAQVPRGFGATVRIAALTAVYVACAIPVAVSVFSKARSESLEETSGTNVPIWRQLLGASLPLLPYYISVMLISQLDKIMIDGILGGGELGKYSVAYSCGIALSAVTGGVAQTLSAWTMRKIRQGDYRKIRNLTHAAEKILSPIILLFLCFIPEVFAFLAPSEYSSAIGAVYPVAISVLPLFLSSLTTSASLYFDKRVCISFTGIGAAIFCVLMNLYLIPRAGIIGAAFSSLISYLSLFLLGSINLKRLSENGTINVNKSVQNLLVCAFFAAILFLIKDYFAIRISIAFIITCYLALTLVRHKNLITES